MKTSILLYGTTFEPSVFDSVLAWCHTLPGIEGIFLAALGAMPSPQSALPGTLPAALPAEVTILSEPCATTGDLLHALKAAARDTDAVLFAFADSPFYDTALTKKLLSTHHDYAAEYTYADGYPLRLVPECLASGTARILVSLAQNSPSESLSKALAAPVGDESIFSVLKTDINSFEIETILSPVDFRSYRLVFETTTPAGKLLCDRARPLWEASAATKAASAEGASSATKATPADTEAPAGVAAVEAAPAGVADRANTAPAAESRVLAFAEAAVKTPGILHTLPGYYAFQIASGCGGQHCLYCPYPARFGGAPKTEAAGSSNMELSSFKDALARIAAFSPCAVIGLSLWGEPLAHPEFTSFVEAALSYRGFSVLVETSLSAYKAETARAVAALVQNAPARTGSAVMWICGIDAATEETYRALHPNSPLTLETALSYERELATLFPGAVYTQMVRVNENESELEAFYRGHENRIIQKYDSFSGLLPDRKPADLSPVVRDPCWHLRCDISVLANGDVPLCRECLSGSIVGNLFLDGPEKVWQKIGEVLQSHIDKNYPEQCRNCDEYYTFNF